MYYIHLYQLDKMKKEEFIKRYGEGAYERHLTISNRWIAEHSEEVMERRQRDNPKTNREISRRGGRYYERHLIDNRTGLRGERNKIRKHHANKWRPYKKLVAPNSQLHHNWLRDSAEYSGLALVEADQHMQGIIDVIEILEGKISIFTEKELREQGGGV